MGMREIRVGMRGFRVGMRRNQGENALNQGGNARNQGGNAGKRIEIEKSLKKFIKSNFLFFPEIEKEEKAKLELPSNANICLIK